MSFVLLLVGLAGVAIGADLLVRSASRLAARFSIPPLIVGLWLIPLGTNAPEMAIGINAVLDDVGQLSVGNIVGATIVKLLLILGIAALIRPLAVRAQTIRLDAPVLVAVSGLFLLVALDGQFSRVDGGGLFAISVLYTAAIIAVAGRERRALRAEYERTYGPQQADATSSRTIILNALGFVAGLAIVVIAADWLVGGASGVARIFGINEAMIGLTIVAIGTSVPELATTIAAVIRRHDDIAVGNLLGSSIFDLTRTLGIVLLISPDAVALPPDLISIDIPVMLIATLICIPVFFSGRRVTRIEGGILIAAYLAYLGSLLFVRL